MSYMYQIDNEVEVPAIWMKDVRKRCYDVIRSSSGNNKGYIKANYDYMLRLRKHCKKRGFNASPDINKLLNNFIVNSLADKLL